MPQAAADGRDNLRRVQRFAGKVLGRKHGLRHQHLKAARRGHAAVLGPQQKLGVEGVVHHVQHGLKPWEGLRVNQASAHVGVHPAGRCVDDNLHIGAVHSLGVKQRAIAAGAAGGQDFACTAVAADRRDCGVGAARAQNQHGLTGEIHAVGLGQIGKACVVCVVAVEPAAPVYHGVHRTDGRRSRVNLVTVGDDQLLIGYRHIDGRKGALFQKGADLGLGGQGHQLIGVIRNLFMDDFGIAVAQLAANQAVQRLLHRFHFLIILGAGRASGPACRSAHSADPAGRRPSGCSAPRRRGAQCRGHGGP